MSFAVALGFVILVGLVVFAVVVVLTSDRDVLVDAPPDRADPRLPEGDVTPADVDRIAFSLALRGYRMDEVDEALDRLREALERRDAELAQLRAAPGEAPRELRPGVTE